jgi:hypothetical protein
MSESHLTKLVKEQAAAIAALQETLKAQNLRIEQTEGEMSTMKKMIMIAHGRLHNIEAMNGLALDLPEAKRPKLGRPFKVKEPPAPVLPNSGAKANSESSSSGAAAAGGSGDGNERGVGESVDTGSVLNNASQEQFEI